MNVPVVLRPSLHISVPLRGARTRLNASGQFAASHALLTGQRRALSAHAPTAPSAAAIEKMSYRELQKACKSNSLKATGAKTKLLDIHVL